MIRRRFPVAVAVGLIGLGAPAGAAAASQSWPYVVSSAHGSSVWHYGGGVDAVSFRGSVRRTLGVLRVKAKYVNQSWQGCGRIRRVKTRNYRMPSFSVQGSYVVVTWRFPLPKQSQCVGASADSVASALPSGVFSQKVPLSRFTCPAVSLRLVGEATVPQGTTPGTLTYQATIVLTRHFGISLQL